MDGDREEVLFVDSAVFLGEIILDNLRQGSPCGYVHGIAIVDMWYSFHLWWG